MKTFTVNGDNPIANFTIANAAQLCSNQPVVLTDASSVTPGSIIRVEVYWDYQNDPTIHTIDDTPSTGKQYNHSYPDLSTPPTENYQLRYVVYSGQNCVKELPQSITVLASPRTQFDPLTNVCEEVAPFALTQGHETEGFAGRGPLCRAGCGTGLEGSFHVMRDRSGYAVLYFHG